MKSHEIARRWVEFFTSKGHTAVPSASLVSSDPSLLFTVAGMVPFIPYLTAREEAPFKRATSVQKCIRTGDIEEVGKTARHGTFFQMCGNFSFGDYFKEEAIGFAWELLTSSVEDGGYGLAKDRLWVTVYQDDDEAARLWEKVAGLPAGADPADGHEGQLLVHRPARPGRPLLGDLLRPRSGLRPGRAAPRLMTRASLRSGTWSSCSTSAARASARTTSRSSANCPRRTSTRAWAWSGWR